MIEQQDGFEDDPKSKTQIKKEMLALQELGEQLTTLTAAQLATIPMDEPLRKAINDAPTITQRSGRKRHLQFIGKLMRSADSEAIQAAYNAVLAKQHASVRQHHQIEQWRDRLLSDEKALAEFISQFPDSDRQHLRQLIRGTQKEQSQNKAPANARKLFKFIRECFEAKNSV